MDRYCYIDDQGNISDALPIEALRKITLPPQTKVLPEGGRKWITFTEALEGQSAIVIPAAPVDPQAASQSSVSRPASPNLTTDDKLLLDRYTKRCATRDRIAPNQKFRNMVCGIISAIGLLILIGSLAGGEDAVRKSLGEQNSGEAGRAMGMLPGSDEAKRLAEQAADITGLTKHEYQSNLGMAAGLIVFGGLLWWRWKSLWEAWPFMRAKAWTGAVFFLLGLMTTVTEAGRGDNGSIGGAVIFIGIGVWLFTSGIAKTKSIIGHLTAPL
ncbi:MAG: hypothetical protein EXS31_02495 [Pedosphaera sp.]|nr:hypothetical protein [Pedosphaera sp.]